MRELLEILQSAKAGALIALGASGNGIAYIFGLIDNEFLGTVSLLVGILVGCATLVAIIDRRRWETRKAHTEILLNELHAEEIKARLAGAKQK